jgi:hypothetical protein
MTMPQAPSLGCAMKCDVRLSRLWPLAATVLSPCDAAARSHPTRGSHGTHNCCILRKPASASRACAAAPSSLWGPPQVFEKAWWLAGGLPSLARPPRTPPQLPRPGSPRTPSRGAQNPARGPLRRCAARRPRVYYMYYHTPRPTDGLALGSKKMFCWVPAPLPATVTVPCWTGDCRLVSGASTGLWRRQ